LNQLDLAERVGQLFMGGVKVDQTPAFVSAALGENHVGSLLLVGRLSSGVKDARTAAARGREVAGSPGGVQPFVAVDQEGGSIQHLNGPGFDTIPSAEEQGTLSPETLRADAASWGAQLSAASIDVDLAPVADIVPTSVGPANQPIARLHRGFGSDAAAVGQHVAAFVAGMADAGVATAVKHFPGLGKVKGNTDFSAGVVDTLTTRNDPDLAPFAAGVAAGAPLVMVSLATYERIDPDRRAAFSPTVIEQMIRGDLGFDGVIMSDDLSAASEVQSVPPGRRAVDFLAAGGDLVVAADPSVLPQMTRAVIALAHEDTAFANDIDQHVLRVLMLKEQMGLLSCS
jgi:beta-N-acetylhexosaminidase